MSRFVEQPLEEAAETFWTAAGGWPGARADLYRAVALVLPLDVVLLGQLRLAHVEAWLAAHGVGYGFGEADRPLYGLLAVYHGAGFVFLDGSDDEAERRFTLAHEVAHFLLDYAWPRQRAAAQLGAGVLDVLDGVRPPTVAEEVAGILAAVDVSPHVHLLPRPGDGGARRLTVAGVEGRADALACELLAPAAAVRAWLEEAGVSGTYFSCVAAAQALLREQYGLPSGAADAYARRLAQGLTGGPSLVSSLVGK